MTMKRILCTVLALTLAAVCLLCGGCSTPSVAMQVNDTVYEMGDYLAYMFETLNSDYQLYMYYAYYGYGSEDIAAQTFTYGEGDDAKELSLDEYVKQLTKDTIIRQEAVKELMKQYKIEWDAELLKTAEENLGDLKTDAYLHLGFNNARYINMYKAVALNESSLFKGLYDDGGIKEVSDADERAWFDKHYYSYKSIEFSLVDSESKELSDAEVGKIETQLNKYLDVYNQNGKNGDAFDVAYRQYLADNTAEDTETKDESATDETLDEEEELETATRNDVIDEELDEELVKVLKEMNEGEIAVKTYKKNGTTKTMALILRMDPEAERGKDKDGKDIDYYADSHDQTLQYMKYDELDKEIEAKVKEVTKTVTVEDRAIKAADPKAMLKLLLGA